MPKKQPRKTYDPVLSCRVPKASKRALAKLAKAKGLRSPAALATQIIVNATKEESP